MKQLDKIMGEKITKLRKHKGMSRQELAEQIGCTTSNVTNMEAGRQPISYVNLLKLTLIFKEDVSYFFPAKSKYKELLNLKTAV